MSDRTVTIGDTTFEHVMCDRDIDVLYLSVGEPQRAYETYGTPEGHAVRRDGAGRIVGITLVNAQLLLERGEMELTVPPVVAVRRAELELALG